MLVYICRHVCVCVGELCMSVSVWTMHECVCVCVWGKCVGVCVCVCVRVNYAWVKIGASCWTDFFLLAIAHRIVGVYACLQINEKLHPASFSYNSQNLIICHASKPLPPASHQTSNTQNELKLWGFGSLVSSCPVSSSYPCHPESCFFIELIDTHRLNTTLYSHDCFWEMQCFTPF